MQRQRLLEPSPLIDDWEQESHLNHHTLSENNNEDDDSDTSTNGPFHPPKRQKTHAQMRTRANHPSPTEENWAPHPSHDFTSTTPTRPQRFTPTPSRSTARRFGGVGVGALQSPWWSTPGEPLSVSPATIATPRQTPGSTVSRNTNATVVVMAIIENRSRELGFAIMSMKSPQIVLSQVADTQTYINLSTNINCYCPTQIVLPNTATHTRLHQLIQHQFGNATIVFVGRRYFNEGAGLEAVRTFAANDVASLNGMETSAKYLCLSACAALVKYIEFSMNTKFASGSVAVSYKSCEGRMLLDVTAASDLELIFNNRTNNKRDSLFGMIDQTQTSGGARLLRATLLQPLTDLPTLQLRHDCVQELLCSPELMEGLQQMLASVPDTEQLLSHLAQLSTKPSLRVAQRAIADTIALRKALALVEPLRDVVLAQSQNELLTTIRQHLSSSCVDILIEKIDKVVDEEAKQGKLTPLERSQQAFSIRPGINGMLDVARKTHLESIDDMNNLATQYRDDWKCTSLKVKYSSSRGYHLHATQDDFEDAEAHLKSIQPSSTRLIQVCRVKKNVFFSTEEFASLNDRNRESLMEISLLTQRVVEHLQTDIRKHMGWLLTFAEAISMVDMLVSFAELASNPSVGGPFTRPDVVCRGELAIKDGRNILTEHQSSEFVPNDTFLTPTTNQVILSGPNMSGKSTYLKQIGLICILAQCGSYIPARFAQIPIIDRLFTRISTDDSMELNLSTFAMEMRDACNILTNVTPQSLVLVDELGRGTSTIDGTAIAWSVAEAIAMTGCFSIVTTHFRELLELETLYPNIRTQYLHVEAGDHEEQELKYSYQLVDGKPPQNPQLVKALALKAGFPREVLSDFDELKKQLCEINKDSSTKATEWIRCCLSIGETMESLQKSTLDERTIRGLLKQLQARALLALPDTP